MAAVHKRNFLIDETPLCHINMSINCETLSDSYAKVMYPHMVDNMVENHCTKEYYTIVHTRLFMHKWLKFDAF